ncbi:MAG: glycogen/starch synthase, ADP-glucose type [Bryobacterales bacterium]|nr:glycogen/starch synthase, ADP-glucose type [Bryobacterales bacterium]
MKILMVASEATPFAKTGGLADVLGSLPPALVRLGDEVGVVLPKYRIAETSGAEPVWLAMPLWVGPHAYSADIHRLIHRGVHYFFLDCPPLYDRPEIYGTYPDNHIRFALLSQAALGIARDIFRPAVLHAHDWQAGLLALYLRTTFAGDPTFFGLRSLLTIHNLGYQGNFPGTAFADLGLDPGMYNPGGVEFWGYVSFLKAGIIWSDGINTVSPTYAREIQTPEYGFGMDGLLRDHASKLSGILNGVDYEEWNPETGPHQVAHYSASDLSGKLVSKKALLAEVGLPANAKRPLIGIVSRLADQKGFDLVEEIADWLADQDLAIVVLGSGQKKYEDMFRQLATVRPEKLAVRIGYDDALAHRIEAGADMFLMPSKYEPCGLSQMYSLRYGTVPIVRATGGLEDTVDEDTGFKFIEYAPEALRDAIDQALQAFANRESWTVRMRRGMAKDFSWNTSAAEYQRLYRSLWELQSRVQL